MPDIKQVIPTAPVVYRFVPIETFDSPETRSTYCAGEQYSVREGNEKLHALVQGWAEAGKVRIA